MEKSPIGFGHLNLTLRDSANIPQFKVEYPGYDLPHFDFKAFPNVPDFHLCSAYCATAGNDRARFFVYNKASQNCFCKEPFYEKGRLMLYGDPCDGRNIVVDADFPGAFDSWSVRADYNECRALAMPVLLPSPGLTVLNVVPNGWNDNCFQKLFPRLPNRDDVVTGFLSFC